MSSWRNSPESWGWSIIILHWISFVLMVGLYLLGAYMVDLTYYDPWYHRGPFWHISFGLVLFALVLFRLALRTFDARPQPLENYKSWEEKAAHFMHFVLYLLLIITSITGYLMTTADGSGVSFFDWFDLPSIINDLENLEDLAGDLHVYATDALMVLMSFHALAALKHHFIDRDKTLTRMMRHH